MQILVNFEIEGTCISEPPGYNLKNFAQPFLISFIDRLV